jgi:hypothetical protein
MNILHVINSILNTSLGKRTRFEAIIEKSSCRHIVYSNPKSLDNKRDFRSEYGTNWEIHNLRTLSFAQQYIKRGGFYFSMPFYF